jgi:nucleoside-diphosphate-sugar epimerase
MDFIMRAAREGYNLALFARRIEPLQAFLHSNGLPFGWAIGPLPVFAYAAHDSFCAVLNFVGVGDPAKAKSIGPDIFSATREADALALAYAVRNPATPYVFMSSGAVYGTDYATPASASTAAIVPINSLSPNSYYSVAKLYAEAVHRAAPATVIDIRIFNYVSRHLDINSRFLLADLVRSIQNNTVFETGSDNIWRDYLHPDDFFQLILACLRSKAGTNMPIDAFSRAPIDKFTLLDLLKQEFGLRFAITGRSNAVASTGIKPFYYSENHAATALGFEPSKTSAEGISEEVAAILRRVVATP